MRRAALLLVLALLAAAVVFWPRPAQGPEDAAHASDPSGAARPPRLAKGKPKPSATPAAESPGVADPAALPPFRFHVQGPEGPLSDVVIAVTDGEVLGNTDSQGRLTTAHVASVGASLLEVVARKPGYAATSAPARRDEPCEIRLARGAWVKGRVLLAPEDRPVDRAIVTAGGLVAMGTTTTGADGAFRVDDVDPDGEVTLVVRAPGRTTATARAHAGESVDIRLADGGTLEGVVSDARGTPIPAAVVLLLAAGADLPPDPARGTADLSTSWREETDRTVTDATGRYEIAGIATAAARVAVALSSSTLCGRSAPVTFERAGQRERRDVVVPAGGGLLVTIDGLDPVEGAESTLLVAGEGVELWLPGTRRGIAGAWEIPALAPGRYQVRAHVPDAPLLGRAARVEAGKTTAVRLVLAGDKTLQGLVTSEDGTAIAGAMLWWQGGTRASADSDENGRFVFRRLDAAPGTLVVAPPEARRQDRALTRTIVSDVLPGRGDPLRLVLSKRPVLRVHVPDLPSGSRIGFDLHARYATHAGGHASVSSDRVLETEVGAIGVPVEWVLRVHDAAPLSLRTGPLAGGEVRDLGEARFDAGRVVELRILHADGTPVAGASVQAEDDYLPPVVTDAKGGAVLSGMPKPSFRIAVRAPEHPLHVIDVPADAPRPLSVVLQREGTLEVRILESGGDPAAGAWVTFRTPEEDPFDYEPDPLTRAERADDDGVWRGPVQPRAYRLFARSLRGVGETTATATVSPGETTVLTLRLP